MLAYQLVGHRLRFHCFLDTNCCLNAVTMTRRVLKDFTFSNGIHIPAGQYVSVAGHSIHTDKVRIQKMGSSVAFLTMLKANYTNPDVFDGFRFSNMREDDGQSIKHQATALALDWVHFGHGRHAWSASYYFPRHDRTDQRMLFCSPGRFFAVNEMKAMLAYTLLTYDVKMEEEGVRPRNRWIGAACIPDQHANVMFRKRAV